MLISILANLALTGGVVPPTPIEQTGDGFRRSEAQRTFGKTEQEKQNELLEEEHEMVFSMFQMFIISNN